MSENNQLSVEIGKRIYNRRKQFGMTQELLSELTDTTPQAISNYERGERELKASTIVKMTDALNISSDYLLKGTGSSLTNQTKNIKSEKLNIIREIIDKCIELSET